MRQFTVAVSVLLMTSITAGLFAFHTNKDRNASNNPITIDTAITDGYTDSLHPWVTGGTLRQTTVWTTHPWLTRKAIELAVAQGVPLSASQKQWILQGSVEEDISVAHTGASDCDYGFANRSDTYAPFIQYTPISEVKFLFRRSENHFLPALTPSPLWVSSNVTDAYSWASNSTRNYRDWADGLDFNLIYPNTPYGWVPLGHVLHILEDMAVPAHTRKDIHAIKKDKFETWAGDLKYNQELTDARLTGFTPIRPSQALASLQEAFLVIRNYTAANYVSEDSLFFEDLTTTPPIPAVQYTQDDDYFYNSSGAKIARKGVFWKIVRTMGKTDAQITASLKDILQREGYIPKGYISIDTACCQQLWNDTAARAVGVAAEAIKLYHTSLYAPVVTSDPAGGISTSSAVLTGTVQTKWLATTAYFEWGVTISYGNSTSARHFSGSGSASSFSENLAGLSPNTTYHFRIAASNSAGTGYGADQTFTTSAPPPAPTAPNLTASVISSSQVDLSWNNVDAEDGYVVWRKAGSGGIYSDIKTVGADTTACSDTGLQASTEYYYKVQPFNISSFAYSNEVTAATPAPPPPPSTPSGLYVREGAYYWSIRVECPYAQGADGYEFWRKEVSTGTYSLNQSFTSSSGITYTDPFYGGYLLPSTTYYYKVRAFNAGGYSAFSDEVSYTTPIKITGTNVTFSDWGWLGIELRDYSNIDGDIVDVCGGLFLGNFTLTGAYQRNTTYGLLFFPLSSGKTGKVHILAKNEGTSYPNTVEVKISRVTSVNSVTGEWTVPQSSPPQQFNLKTGEIAEIIVIFQ